MRRLLFAMLSIFILLIYAKRVGIADWMSLDLYNLIFIASSLIAACLIWMMVTIPLVRVLFFAMLLALLYYTGFENVLKTWN